MNQNLSSGKWAVAVVGLRGWMRESALGDGITNALNALVTRMGTRQEAEAVAAKLNSATMAILPGGSDVCVYESRPYRRADYIGSQQLANGQNRDCDRRIADTREMRLI